jgi:hypothetical protein
VYVCVCGSGVAALATLRVRLVFMSRDRLTFIRVAASPFDGIVFGRLGERARSSGFELDHARCNVSKVVRVDSCYSWFLLVLEHA